jgi:ankyrin repeat protein
LYSTSATRSTGDDLKVFVIELGSDTSSNDADKQKGLRKAIFNGRIGDVKKFLNDDTVDVNGKNFTGLTALHWACDKGHYDIVELLLDHGADIEAVTNVKSTPLMSACWCGHVFIVKLLLDRGCAVNAVSNDRETALHWACRREGSTECVKELLAHGSDTSIKNKDGKTPLDMTGKNKHRTIVEGLLMEHDTPRPEQLFMDSVQGVKESMLSEMSSLKSEVAEYALASTTLEQRLSLKFETLIDRRCKELKDDIIATVQKDETKSITEDKGAVMSTIDKQQGLRDAAREGRIDDVKLHVKDDAVDVNDNEYDGWTALHWACKYGHHDIAELLLDHGADIEAQTDVNATPFIYACYESHLSTVKLLLSRGCAVNAVDTNGTTALHWACWDGSTECVKELLAHGADTSIKNKDGKTPFDEAKENNQHTFIDVLMEDKKRTAL